MKKLTERNAYLISNAAKTVGLSMEIWDYIFEDVFIDEAKDIKAFIEYLVKNKIPFTERTLTNEFKLWKTEN